MSRFGISPYVAGGKATYVNRGQAYQTGPSAPTQLNGNMPGGYMPAPTTQPLADQLAQSRAPKPAPGGGMIPTPSASVPQATGAGAGASPMMPAPPSLQSSFGLRQNIAKTMQQAGYTQQQVAQQQLEYMSGTPVQAGGNYFQNRGLVTDANARLNAESGANVGVANSVAAGNNATAAQTTALIPTMQQIGQANAGLTNAQTGQINAMLPGQVAAQQIGNAGQAMLIPSLIQQGQNQARAGQLANQTAAAQIPYAGQMAQAQVAAAGLTPERFKQIEAENQRLRDTLSRYQNQRTGSQLDDLFGGGTGQQPAAAPAPMARTAAVTPAQPAAPAAPARVSNEKEYNALPAGAEYVGPDGVHRRKGGAVAQAGQ